MILHFFSGLGKIDWRTPHYLSLDVVVGTVLSFAAASRLPDGTAPFPVLTALVLALAVWTIYTLDRLLDLCKPAALTTARHNFHRTHRAWLGWAVGGAGLLAGTLSFWLPGTVWRLGLGLGAVTGGYLLLVSRLSGRNAGQALKEPFTALIYTAGVWSAALAPHPVITWPDVVLTLLFGVLVFQSLLIYSWFESHESAGTVTLATWLHPDPAAALAEGLAVGIGIVFAVVSWIGVEHYQQRFLFVELGMTAIHGLLVRYRAFFQSNTRYRLVGELVFWLPGLLL